MMYKVHRSCNAIMYDIHVHVDVPYTDDFKELLTAYCIIYVMR